MTTEAAIQAQLAPLVTGRCYPLTAPDPVVKPYIIFSIISDVQQNNLDGYAGISNKRVQIDVYTTNYGSSKTLALAVKASMSTASFTNTHMMSQDLFENDTQLYRVTMDYSVWD